MGVLLFRASPVWVLAALADVCGLGRQLIPEITEALKKEGLLAPNDSFTTMDQLLEGLERSAGHLASTVNAPPLDVAGLRREWGKLVSEVRGLPAPKLPSRSAVTRLWTDLRDEAAAQDRSVFELSSVLAISAVGALPERARVLSKASALAFGKGGTVLADALLAHYRATLHEIHDVGFLAYGSRQLTPYVRAALTVFSPQRETLTGNFVGKLPPHARLAAEFAAHLLVLAFALLVLVWGGAKLVTLTFLTGQVSPALGLKMGYVYLALPVSGGFIALFAAEALVLRLATRRQGAEGVAR